MAANQKTNRMERQVSDQALISGLNKHASTLPSLTLGGTAVPVSTITAALQARIDTANAVVVAKAAWQKAVAAARDQLAQSDPQVLQVRQALQIAYGSNLDTLADFGLSPRKPRQVATSDTNAAKAAKARATRTARHTMGSQQKKTVTGNVTGVIVTPVTASPTVTAPPAAGMPSAPTPTAQASPPPATNAAPQEAAPSPAQSPSH
ncbi:MAG: hypothetical protein FWD17_09490 [Polyangiaceae bacterium]|nr:hypothetical protein [Polyangiaceae bacterium]